MMSQLSPLSVDERIELSHLEQRIETGLKAAWEAGKALQLINERRLYREQYGTFENYCQQRWNLCRQRAYQFIDAAIAYQNLSTSVDILPISEFQVRPVASLPAESQVEAWEAAVEISGGTPTHKHTTRTATAVKAKPKTAVEPGQVVEVMVEESPFYGQSVRVQSVKGIVAQVETPDGVKPLLIDELVTLPDKPAPKPKPQPLPSTFESLQARSERMAARVEIVEDALLNLIEAVEDGNTDKALELATQARELFI